MKKLLLSLLIILSLFDSVVFAQEDSIDIDLLSSKLRLFANHDISIDKIETLLDVNDDPNYLLVEFENTGYAIVTKTNLVISELSLDIESPYKHMTKGIKHYYGYGNYYVSNNLYNRTDNINQQLINANEIMLNSKNEGVLLNDKMTWDGINEETMKKYNWPQLPNLVSDRNGDGIPDGICGSAASSILLAYYQDNINALVVPHVIRNLNSNSPDMLMEVLWYQIDFRKVGTMPNEVASGINNVFDLYEPNFGYHNYRARFTLAPTMLQSIQLLHDKKPIVLGLLSALGSSYGDHWVTAYAYSLDSGNNYYKVVDNWAPVTKNGNYPIEFPIISDNYRVIINKSWSSSFVYLQ